MMIDMMDAKVNKITRALKKVVFEGRHCSLSSLCPQASTMTSASTAVPLTTHNLQQEDRSRLIRSTRKIQEVVGETPHFVDVAPFTLPPPPSSRTPKRSRHRFTPDTPVPASPGPPGPTSDARPLLYIRVPDIPPPGRAPVTPAPSPTLTVVLNLRHAAKDEASRRRKMAKLFRTLGTNVPPELVFPPTSPKDRRARRLTARTLMSDRADTESVTGVHIERWRSTVSVTARAERKRTSAKADSISHGWVWVGKPEEIPPNVRVRVRPRSRAHSGLPTDWVEVERPGVNADIVEESRMIPQSTLSRFHGIHREEEGWSGEWVGAVSNMDDVVRSLRHLRVK
ncbi:hypothetical protein DFH07DRAFT_1058585 [Mycena maculata]|uniref:Uncharacterized protein n=1 Tax=Mycena maculata TaxID=230809 RepID=A0AAD7JPZ1_9AGAR|nr:hypothetical protein DFH07DRAFT_1058585 [Mycena maculata]